MKIRIEDINGRILDIEADDYMDFTRLLDLLDDKIKKRFGFK